MNNQYNSLKQVIREQVRHVLQEKNVSPYEIGEYVHIERIFDEYPTAKVIPKSNPRYKNIRSMLPKDAPYRRHSFNFFVVITDQGIIEEVWAGIKMHFERGGYPTDVRWNKRDEIVKVLETE